MLFQSFSTRNDNTCIDVARNNKTAMGIVNVTCIAFDAVVPSYVDRSMLTISCLQSYNYHLCLQSLCLRSILC